MRPDDLVLSRDIRGDGGWSLNHPDMIPFPTPQPEVTVTPPQEDRS